MTYQELRAIYNKYISVENNQTLPIDAFAVVSKLNLRLKNSVECKRDFNGKEFPLSKCNAFYALCSGEFTIYYDEHYPYKNFAVAHEVAHHILRHCSDGTDQHHDANLLAAIIVAPVELIKKHKIKSAVQLSEICKIPINTAEMYWSEISPKNRAHHLRAYIAAAILSFIIITAGVLAYSAHKPDYNEHVTPTELSTAPEKVTFPSEEPSVLEAVFVTTNGSKYHKENCFHIKGHNNILEISLDAAISAGYEACKDCI